METKNRKRTDSRFIPHRVLREIYRHYIDFQDYYQRTGNDTIEYKGYVISFIDLKGSLSQLSKRKREAFFYNVILDKKQEDVAKIMDVTTVTVGQYVEAACIILAKNYFPELEEQSPKGRKPKQHYKNDDLDT